MSFARERKTRVVRAAEKAQRAQNATQIVSELLEPQPRNRDRCGFCGLPSPKRDGVCPGHRDLGGIR